MVLQPPIMRDCDAASKFGPYFESSFHFSTHHSKIRKEIENLLDKEEKRQRVIEKQ